MVVQPYQTSLLEKTNIQSIKQGIESAYIQRDLVEMGGYELERDFDVFAIVGREDHDRINAFYQPILLEGLNKKHPERAVIVYDARPYDKMITIDEISGDFRQGKITGHNDSLNLLQMTAVFMGIYRNRPNTIVNLTEVPILTYGSLLTESIGRKLGLDPATQLNLMSCFHIFYASRAYLTLKSLEAVAEKNQFITALVRKTNGSVDIYKRILESMNPEVDLANIINLAEYIRNQKWSPRLDHLSAREIYALVMNAWIGQGNPKETMLVALEFPPTWISMVYLMSQGSFYQKTSIGQILKRLDRGNNMKNFSQQLVYLMR